MITVKTGQQFGYSSSLGKFTRNNCFDFVVTAPLYSKLSDEGVAFVYNCNPSLDKFYETPTLLFGESFPNARFGISVANLKDVNHDNYDVLLDLAILAPNWYEGSPHIFVYVSSLGGFSTSFSQKIIVEKSQQPIDVLSYGLLSQFDVNNDGVNDIAISLPNNKKVLIISGIRFTKITVIFNNTLNTSINQPHYGCYPKSDIEIWWAYFFFI
ncbi:hypothetical protein MXB_2032 [Myxobolus squamalis]|nr:hypothetical protein MXB_2032 [Myxobolus squamalis]